MYDHDSSDHPEEIGSILLTLAQMQSMAESASPARLGKGARDAGELWVKECTVEQSKEYGAVGEYLVQYLTHSLLLSYTWVKGGDPL